MKNSNWMIYGAYGYTGKLIVAEAIRNGYRPLLAGRSKDKLIPLAETLCLDWVVLDLDDTEKLQSIVSKMDLVLNVAGPFFRTSEKMVEACLKGSTHYLDIANEIPVIHKLFSINEQAVNKEIALITGVGFGAVATNCLVKYVAEQAGDPIKIECASIPHTNHRSSGATKTILDVLTQGGKVIRDGKLVSSRLGTGAIKVPFPDGIHDLLPIPTGDLKATQLATGVPNVTAYTTELPKNPVFFILFPIIRKALSSKFIHNKIDQKLDKQKNMPEQKKPNDFKNSYSWAKAVNREGEEYQAWLKLGEGYQFTAYSSILAVDKVLNSKLKGFLTPAEAFGTSFVLEIPGVSLQDQISVNKTMQPNGIPETN